MVIIYTPVRFDYVGNNNLKPVISHGSLQKCHNIDVLNFEQYFENLQKKFMTKKEIHFKGSIEKNLQICFTLRK